MSQLFNPYDPVTGLPRYLTTSQREAAGLPAKVRPTPEQRMWAFERIYPSLTDAGTLKQIMQHAEDLAQWVANGNAA